jgi:hypothetical protein
VQTTGFDVNRENGTATVLFKWITSHSAVAISIAQDTWSSSFNNPELSEVSGQS